MQIKDILLLLHADAPSCGTIGLAARVAAGAGAHVRGVCLYGEPNLPQSDGYAIGNAAVADVLEQRDLAVRRQISPIERTFRETMLSPGIEAVWLSAGPGESPKDTAFRARFADLVIVGQPDPGRPAELALVTELVLAAGTPCMIQSGDVRGAGAFNRIVVAWDASANAKRALDAAMTFLKTAAAVEILLVDEDRPRADDEWSNALLNHLGRHGVHAALRHDQGRARQVGEVILDGCDRFGADLLVMGAYGHGRTAETFFGGASRTVLSSARVPVLMAH
jgi:nucleotide-binding universal stress UspA family protein